MKAILVLVITMAVMVSWASTNRTVKATNSVPRYLTPIGGPRMDWSYQWYGRILTDPLTRLDVYTTGTLTWNSKKIPMASNYAVIKNWDRHALFTWPPLNPSQNTIQVHSIWFIKFQSYAGSLFGLKDESVVAMVLDCRKPVGVK